jgi:putative flippase GtrA
MTTDAGLTPPPFPPPAEHQREKRRFAIFVMTGGFAAFVNIMARWLLSKALFYELAVAMAYLIGMTTAFLLARAFVFTAGGRHWTKEFGRFALVNAFSLLIVLGVSTSLARLLFPAIGFDRHGEDVAHIIGVASPILLSFYAHKHFSFGKAGGSASHD